MKSHQDVRSQGWSRGGFFPGRKPKILTKEVIGYPSHIWELKKKKKIESTHIVITVVIESPYSNILIIKLLRGKMCFFFHNNFFLAFYITNTFVCIGSHFCAGVCCINVCYVR